MNQQNFTIYALINTDNNTLFYVGQTCMNLYYRLVTHINYAKKGQNGPVYEEIRTLIENDKNPIIISLFQFAASSVKEGTREALRREKDAIVALSNLGTLKNICHNPFYDRRNKMFIEPPDKTYLKKKYKESDSEAYPPPPSLAHEERVTWHNKRALKGLDKFTYDEHPEIQPLSVGEMFDKLISICKEFSLTI